MNEKGLDLAIKEFGEQMGIADFELDLCGFTNFELETGETFNLELSNHYLLIYLAIDVLPYIVSRVLENLYLMANHRTHGDMPFTVGLHRSNILICMHIEIDTVTGMKLNQAAESLWELRKSVLN
jgi:type III secretion system chaperone SycN